MTTIYENQSIAFTDLSGNTATKSPAVGFNITTSTQTLTANVNGKNIVGWREWRMKRFSA